MKLTNLVQRAITAIITAADGAIVALGTTTDAATGTGVATTVIGALRAIRDRLLATLVVRDTWTPTLTAEVTADDSDKSFTVPASTEWAPTAIYIAFTTTATVGNRQISILYTTAAGATIAAMRASVVQPASQTYLYSFWVNTADMQVLRDTTFLAQPLPAVVLPAGYIIRVYDNKAIAAAADDMLVQLMVQARAV